LQYLALQIGSELLSKISTNLSNALQELLYHSQRRKLKEKIVQIYEPGLSLGHTQWEEYLITIVKGIEQQRYLLIAAKSRESIEVMPRTLLLHEGKWVLVCDEWVPDEPDNRSKTLRTKSIRIDSMISIPQLGKQTTFMNQREPIETNSSFGPAVGEEVHTVRLRIHGRRGRYFCKECWHPTQKILSGTADSETMDIEFRVNDLRYFKFLVRRWLPHAEVLSPIELRDTLRQDIIQAMTRYR
jgi:hypothetical protein